MAPGGYRPFGPIGKEPVDMRRYRRRDVLAAGAALALGLGSAPGRTRGADVPPDLILTNGRFTTLDRTNPSPEAVAIAGSQRCGRIRAVRHSLIVNDNTCCSVGAPPRARHGLLRTAMLA